MEENDTQEPTQVEPSLPSPEEPNTVSMSEIAKLQKEREEYKHKYLHLLADSENTRKRLQKDRDETVQYAIKSLLLEFLHPIDHFETALLFTEQGSDEVKQWALGFNMILNQFKEVLGTHGVTPIDAKGKLFDPHFHEAIEMIETEEHPPGFIVEESGRGYLIKEKMLRPSRVKVSKKLEIEQEPSDEQK